MRFLRNSALDPKMFVEESFFPADVQTASRHFLEDADYVTKSDITDEFIDAFWNNKSWVFGR